jgi:hypothetical protein
VESRNSAASKNPYKFNQAQIELFILGICRLLILAHLLREGENARGRWVPYAYNAKKPFVGDDDAPFCKKL